MTSKHRLLLILLLISIALFHLPLSGQVVINEYSASNLSSTLDNHNKYEDWIELYNNGVTSVDLGGFYLSDKVSTPSKWQIPVGTSIPAGGFLIFWTSGRDESVGGNFHTNFKLTQTKTNPEYAVFAAPNGAILDQVVLSITQLGHSMGRTTNGSAFWSVFTNPTPKSSNNFSTPYQRYTVKPTMNLNAGFYPGPITVALGSTEPSSQIRYTLNGSEPTAVSSLYTAPLALSLTTVVKARIFSIDPSILPGLIEFNTYFINVSHSLVVVSIASNTLETLLNGNEFTFPVGSFEYFNKSGLRTTYGYGDFNSHGQDSWVHDQRSIDYVTRDEMGYDNAIHEKIFSLSNRSNFQRIILRAAGDDNYPGIDSSAHMRDFYAQNLAKRTGMKLDVRTGERCIMYVNGKYWGIYALREKVDDPDYTKYYYDQEKYDLDFIMIWGNTWVEYSENSADSIQIYQNWANLYNYIQANDMTVQSNYDYVANQYDVTSLTDYVLLNSYVVCADWLNWNTAWWRGMNPLGTHQKWGYNLWDEDATFGHYYNYTDIPSQTPDVDPCFPEGISQSWQDPEGHIKVLNKLRTNQGFEQYYVSRYIDLLNTGFSCDSMLDYLDSLELLIAPEMPAHVARWGGTVSKWQSNVQKLRNFVTTRCSTLPNGLNSCYALTGPYPLKFNIDPPGAGNIQVNSLTLGNFPWSGSYYSGIDIKLKAIAKTNYQFDRWVLKSHTVTPADTAIDAVLNITMSDSVIALFKLKQTAISTVVQDIEIKVYPNPFDIKAIFYFKNLPNSQYTLYLYNTLGIEVRRIGQIIKEPVEISKENLSSGLYIYKLMNKDGDIIKTGKLVVQ